MKIAPLVWKHIAQHPDLQEQILAQLADDADADAPAPVALPSVAARSAAAIVEEEPGAVAACASTTSTACAPASSLC